MPTHWTYEKLEASADLAQGDILSPTEALREVFSSVHPHFRDDKYLGFIVATQSCDLVRRTGVPKAGYVNLAAIRPLSQVITKIVAHAINPEVGGLFRSSAKSEAHRLFERLLNQNEQGIGLFFLYPDSDAGIAEPAIAFLRISVALRREHYDVLVASRVGRLTAEFQAKLGWLIGNLYDRPATRDWTDSNDGKKRFLDLIDQCMSELRWIDDEIVKAADEKGVDIANTSVEALEKLRPPSALERALAEVERELGRVASDLPPDVTMKLINRLRNSGRFRKLFRPQLAP